jgi:para-nitrobenzyl esterase
MAIAETRSGKVEGVERDGVLVFKGIPYAAPPVGARRWRAPVREEAWDGVRDATRFSAQCAQGAFAMNAMFGGEEPEISEDGLYLNVWTPACDDARRPVMIWIHGGAFVFGAGDTPWYDGTRFARDGDIVLVTINYRLGPFGFLHLGDLFGSEFEGSGNAGILDQVAALEWVRDSIAGFGGDPDRVTVFGESAGGGSVGTLLGLPAAQGLFRSAIPQSGASSWWGTREQATTVATAMIDTLGVAPGDTDALRSVSMQSLIDAATAVGTAALSRGLAFQPVVDGTALPRPPLESIEAGNAAGVHLLTGTNRHEATLFNLLDPSLTALEVDGVVKRVQNWYTGDAAALVETYRRDRPGVSGLDLWTEVGTDAVFRMPAIRLAEAQSTHAPVWMYLFTWESPQFGGALRSTHALEIPFMFDNLDHGAELFTGTAQNRQDLADAMHKSWVAFGHDRNPNHDGIPTWPQYDVERRATMSFDIDSEVVDDPLGTERAAWGDYRH